MANSGLPTLQSITCFSDRYRAPPSSRELATWAASRPCGRPRRSTAEPSSACRPGSRQLALTYDDGPNDPYTWRLLEVLDRHHVKATFFLIGTFVAAAARYRSRRWSPPDTRSGATPGTIPTSSSRSSAEVRRQLQQTQQGDLRRHRRRAKLFRPPFGGRRPISLSVARSLGLQPVMWNVTCRDWKAKSADEIVAHAERQIRGGDVILLTTESFTASASTAAAASKPATASSSRYKRRGI